MSKIAKEDNYYCSDRNEMLQFIPKNAKKVLEIGCGEGVFSAAIKAQNNAECWGVEIDPASAKKAAQKLDKIVEGNILYIFDQLPTSYFDVIVCNDVVEHLTDHYLFISKIKEHIQPNGVIVLSIPNIRYFRELFSLFFKKDWTYKNEGNLDYTHYRFFTTKSIKKLFEEHDYTLLQIKGINPTKSIKPWFAILLTFYYFWDIRFMQFAVTAKPNY